MRIFASLTGANVPEAEFDLGHYQTISEFFTRALKPGLRPISEEALVSPVDGFLREAAVMQGGEILQVKGHRYQVEELLCDPKRARNFRSGHYFNFSS